MLGGRNEKNKQLINDMKDIWHWCGVQKVSTSRIHLRALHDACSVDQPQVTQRRVERFDSNWKDFRRAKQELYKNQELYENHRHHA